MPRRDGTSDGGTNNGVYCVCPPFLDPVCGRDGVTYDNLCQAKCKGTVSYRPFRNHHGSGKMLSKTITHKENPNNYDI